MEMLGRFSILRLLRQVATSWPNCSQILRCLTNQEPNNNQGPENTEIQGWNCGTSVKEREQAVAKAALLE